MEDISTYLLCGLYRDYGMHKETGQQKVAHSILLKRWKANPDDQGFIDYFKTWELTYKDFNLPDPPGGWTPKQTEEIFGIEEKEDKPTRNDWFFK